ncbi:hypothetical protein ACFC1R_36290 [Kitasatospora sp. NPDC056138]
MTNPQVSYVQTISPIEFEEKYYANPATAESVNLKPRKPVLTS